MRVNNVVSISNALLGCLYGTGGDADGRDVVQGNPGCPSQLFVTTYVLLQTNHVNKYPGVWGRAPF